MQDRARSDSLSRACDIMHLQGLMRHAVNILKGTRILLTRDTFHVAAVSVIPVIKIAERCEHWPTPSCDHIPLPYKTRENLPLSMSPLLHAGLGSVH
jgi:hypothetical protein